MRDPQLSPSEQIAWVIPCSGGKYITISPRVQPSEFVAGDFDDAFCMAREADARALYNRLMRAGYMEVREPERRVVPSHPTGDDE